MSIINFIDKDKLMHFVVCLVLTLVIFIICCACGLSASIASVPAFFGAIIVGVCKEVYDSKHGGVFDHYDIVADFLGAFLGIILVACIIAIF